MDLSYLSYLENKQTNKPRTHTKQQQHYYYFFGYKLHTTLLPRSTVEISEAVEIVVVFGKLLLKEYLYKHCHEKKTSYQIQGSCVFLSRDPEIISIRYLFRMISGHLFLAFVWQA